MNFPSLPELPDDPRMGMSTGPALPPSISDVNNPGSSSPLTQQFARPTLDQAQLTTTSSNPGRTSDGQFQRINLAAGQQGVGVSVSLGTGPVKTSSAEKLQVGAKENLDLGTRVETKGRIALNVYPGGQNLSTPMVTIAEHLPVSTNKDGGGGSVRGVPTSVNIR